MKKLKDNWLVFNDKLQLVRVLAKDILNIAKESILNKGSTEGDLVNINLQRI